MNSHRALILVVDPIQRILRFTSLTLVELALAAMAGLVLLIACEVAKAIMSSSSNTSRGGDSGPVLPNGRSS